MFRYTIFAIIHVTGNDTTNPIAAAIKIDDIVVTPITKAKIMATPAKVDPIKI